MVEEKHFGRFCVKESLDWMRSFDLTAEVVWQDVGLIEIENR